MFESLKNTIGNRVLKNYMVGRTRVKAFSNLDTMKSVGILFEYSEDLYPITNKAIKFFQSRKINTYALAYRNVKRNEINSMMQTSFEIKTFTKSDLTWFNKPKGEEVNDFIARPFDVLIDFTRSNEFMYRYIVMLSAAKCKIGGLQYKNDPYDLILLEKENNSEKFMNLIINFLASIKI